MILFSYMLAVQADSGSEDNTPETATRSTGKRKTAHSGKSRGKEASKAKDSPSKASYSHWLMKSEPESRFQNGIDMKVATVCGNLNTMFTFGET